MQALLVLALLSAAASLDVPFCTQSHVPNVLPFTYTINGTKENTTSAHMCHDDDFLYVYWWNIDDDVISTYQNCNDPLYNEDAVEIFIATNSSYPKHYFEFEVSPKGKLFFADIVNPNLTCSNLGTTYYPCTSAEYSGKLNSKGWQASLKIGLEIIGRGMKQKYFKGNLFRIDKSKSKATRYLSYSPTLTSPACFHQPLKFVDFYLV